MFTFFVVCTGALVGLESDFFEVEESISSFDICVELKDPIKRNITIYLTVFERTAAGNSADYSTMKINMLIYWVERAPLLS